MSGGKFKDKKSGKKDLKNNINVALILSEVERYTGLLKCNSLERHSLRFPF